MYIPGKTASATNEETNANPKHPLRTRLSGASPAPVIGGLRDTTAIGVGHQVLMPLADDLEVTERVEEHRLDRGPARPRLASRTSPDSTPSVSSAHP
jgi:hypothetical protein